MLSTKYWNNIKRLHTIKYNSLLEFRRTICWNVIYPRYLWMCFVVNIFEIQINYRNGPFFPYAECIHVLISTIYMFSIPCTGAECQKQNRKGKSQIVNVLGKPKAWWIAFHGDFRKRALMRWINYIQTLVIGGFIRIKFSLNKRFKFIWKIQMK